MKPIHVSSDIIPIGDFKARASAILREARKHSRPVVITQNGKPAVVLLSAEEFDRLTESARFVAGVHEGLEDSKRKRVISDDAMGRVLDREFGPRRK